MYLGCRVVLICMTIMNDSETSTVTYWPNGNISVFRHIFFYWLDISVTTIREKSMWLDWLIFDFLLKAVPLPTPSPCRVALFPHLWHSERMGNGHIEYQVADWGCHSGPSGPWVPDVLVHWCQDQELSRGLVSCRGGQTVWRSFLGEVPSPH